MALGLGPRGMAELVPEAEGWPGGVFGWISAMGSFAALIGYAELLWPDFEVFDDCVLRAPVDEVNHRAWMDRLNADRTSVEQVCNHIDLLYLFHNPAGPAIDAQLTYVGRLFQDLWRAKLAREFPDRRFAVEFHDDPGNPNDNPLVTFSQIRNPREDLFPCSLAS